MKQFMLPKNRTSKNATQRPNTVSKGKRDTKMGVIGLVGTIIIIKGQRMIEIALSDIDFYERKIQTLEQDNVYLHDEIIKLRTRLRTAEDFQIKYGLLVSANQKEIAKVKSSVERQEEIKWTETLAGRLKENDAAWKEKCDQLQERLKKEHQLQVESVRRELAEKTAEFDYLSKKSQQIELFGFKMNKIDKENQLLKEEIQEMKAFYEKQRNEEQTKLRAALNATYRERIQAEKKRYEEKINHLQERLNILERQDDNINFKVSDATNRQLASLKTLLSQKSEEYANELQYSQQLLTQKNQELQAILKDRLKSQAKHSQQLSQKNQSIKQLQTKLIQRQKQHEVQLLNLVQRNNAMLDQEKEEQDTYIKRLNAENTRMNDLWSQKILNHQNQIEDLHQKFQEERRKLIEEKNMNKRKLSEISLKAREADGEREIGQTQMLLNSFRDIDGKQDKITSYENGITFLERQYKKCQLKLEEKSRLVSKLYKEINDIRSEDDKELSQLKEKIKKDKKQNVERITTLENQLRDANERIKNKEKEERKKERQQSKEMAELQAKNKALIETNEELVRDYNRVIEDKKDIEASYREERQKSFTSKSDLNIIKKQKWLQLEKQKNELQVIFKEKEEQLKIGYEQQIDQLNSKLNRLRQEYDLLANDNELLRKNLQKYEEELKGNKENSKMAEYNKKLASLNLQIALTQNLCESLKKAKSRANNSAEPWHQQSVGIEVGEFQEHEQPLLMSFHPSHTNMK